MLRAGGWLIAAMFVVGCGTQPQGGPGPGQPGIGEDPEPRREPAPVIVKWERLEKPKVDLAPVEFQFGNVALVIDAPPGTKAMPGLINTVLSDGGQFTLVVSNVENGSSPACLRQLGGRMSDAGWLMNEPDIAVLSFRDLDGSMVLDAAVARDIGHQVLFVSPLARDSSQPKPTQEEMRLMVYCATTLKRKDPLPADPQAEVKEIANVALASEGVFENVHFQSVTADGLKAMAPALQQVKVLAFHGSIVGDETLRQAATLPGVEVLILRGTGVTDAGLASLAGLPKLRALELDDSVYIPNHITGATLGGLAKSPLERLEILVPLSPEGWAAVAKLTQLKSLKAPSSNGMDDQQLASLAGLTELEELIVHHAPLTDAACETIGKFTKLKVLWLSSAKITDAGFAKLAGLTQLETLAIDGTEVSDASLPVLMAFKQLQQLHARDSKVTEAAVKQLKAANPKLK